MLASSEVVILQARLDDLSLNEYKNIVSKEKRENEWIEDPGTTEEGTTFMVDGCGANIYFE